VEYLKRYFVITNLAQSFLPMPTRSSLIIYWPSIARKLPSEHSKKVAFASQMNLS
jgi:hypothetical protein